MSANLVLVSWCPSTGCEEDSCNPCRIKPKYWCYTTLSVSTGPANVFGLSGIFTGPVLDRASGELAGSAPSGNTGGVWPGTIPNTFVFPAAGTIDHVLSISPVAVSDPDCHVLNPDVIDSFSRTDDVFNPDTPNQYWGYASVSGGYTWNETGWFGDPAHSHIVGDGGTISPEDYIYYGEIAGPPDPITGNRIHTAYILDGDGPDCLFLCQKQRIWTRVEHYTLESTADVLYFATIAEYDAIAATAFSTTDGGGVTTAFYVSDLNYF